MKKWSIVVTILFVLSIFFIFDDEEQRKMKKNIEERAVYFSYIEFNKYIANKSEEEQKTNIKKVLDNIKELDFNTIIVHVRAFSDAIYKSKYYPYSEYINNDKGETPSYDVLEYFISESHKRDISFEAWVNPYRISNSKDESSLNSRVIYDKYQTGVTEKGIYLNPASSEVRTLIVNGIVEIVKNYDVDGVHFDDYFYPDKEIDLKLYDEYKKDGGKLTIDEYRYNNVNILIKEVYNAIKKVDKKVLFGIAPEGNLDNCYEYSYLDVKEILSKPGYVDYIMPQIYYGFDNETRPFKDTVKQWNNLIKVDTIKLIPALAFYKVGNFDKYALSGSNEWMNEDDIIAREIKFSRSLSHYGGFSLFSYNYMFNSEYKNNTSDKELSNIKKVILE